VKTTFFLESMSSRTELRRSRNDDGLRGEETVESV
jgi:hypothetical protein